MGSDRIFTCKDCRYSAHLGYVNNRDLGWAGWVPDKLLHKDVNFGMEALNK